MLRNYFITAFRYIIRNKIQSFIQVLSLAIGITAVITIGLFVDNELSYDKFNKKIDRIYRLEFGDFAGNPSAVGHNIKDNFSEVENIVRIRRPETTRMSYISDRGNGSYKRTDLKVKSVDCDSTIFDIFTFPFIQGDPKTALMDPNSIVLTESTANALFGNQDPMGEFLEAESADSTKSLFNVTGVIHDVKNSHIDFDILFPMVRLEDDTVNSGEKILNTYSTSARWFTYLLLPDQKQKLTVEKRINEFFSEPIKDATYYSHEKIFSMRPLEEIYFSSPLTREWGYCLHGNIRQLRILLAIAIFILLLACINYINLTTARASMRAREVGIRKVTGAFKPQLIVQFFLESIITSLVSFLIAITIVQLLLPTFNELAMADLSMERLFEPKPLLLTVAGILILGFIAGIYPALYLTSFGTIVSLKGNQLKGESSIFLRRILLTFQFTISVVLIIGVFTILAQLEYMKTADLGFSRELIINIPNMGFTVDKRQVFKDKLLTNPNVMKVSFGLVPGERIQPFPGYVEYQNIKIKPSIVWTDPDYFEVMDIEILEGRNFSWDREGDLWRMDHQEENVMRVIINKAATKAFEIKSPIGEILTYEAGFRYEIIGVVEDFHFFSLHHKINPTFYFWHRSAAGVSIKILPHDIQGTIKIIKNEYESIFPNLTFEFSFLDDTYNQQYEDDERFSKIIRNFAIVAILIACLGLFGLSSFMAARRTKEIGIRKAMGASVRSVFLLLSREFVKWVVLSVIIACPVAWIIMNRWLQSFAFRTNIGVGSFILAIVIAFAIAFLTVAWQSLKTARTNPIEALRYE